MEGANEKAKMPMATSGQLIASICCCFSPSLLQNLDQIFSSLLCSLTRQSAQCTVQTLVLIIQALVLTVLTLALVQFSRVHSALLTHQSTLHRAGAMKIIPIQCSEDYLGREHAEKIISVHCAPNLQLSPLVHCCGL